MRMNPPKPGIQTGVLFKGRGPRAGVMAQGGAIALPAGAGAMATTRGRHTAAYAGVYLFTLLLYARPNDLFPFLGAFPLVKIVAITVTLAYIMSKISSGERLVIWNVEIAMLTVITALAVLLMPIAASPKDGFDMLTDTFLKTVVIFILMTNLIDTRTRLLAFWKLVVACCAVLGLSAIKSYAAGELTMQGKRIEGLVGGIFGNPNDLATALDVVLPFAVILTLVSKGRTRLFYLGCTAAMAVGVLVTFSRGGFLGLIALAVVLLWKLGRGRRIKTMMTAALVAGAFLIVTPGGYGNRLGTIFNIGEDQTGSAQERRFLMELAASLAIHHPIVGVGIGNFHIYSYREKEAHNAYLEIAAELGVLGLLAYLMVIFAPLRSVRRIEKRTSNFSSASDREMYWLSVSLQAALVAYMVCSFFASIQYLWYLYYTAAYAVALRQIHAAEVPEGSSPGGQASAARPINRTKWPRGVLWAS